MNDTFYIVKRSRNEISVYKGQHKIGSLPSNAVIEIDSFDGRYFVEAGHMDHADLVAYIIQHSTNLDE